MTIRDMWNDFETRSTMAAETPHEIALQRIGYVCGMVAALGELSRGNLIAFDARDVEELLDESFSHMRLKIEAMTPEASEN